MENEVNKKIVKNKIRIQNHGEVYTPRWLVQKMLDEKILKNILTT